MTTNQKKSQEPKHVIGFIDIQSIPYTEGKKERNNHFKISSVQNNRS
jgi:hypothetical protein